jgi:hypothetical protein
VYSRPDGGYELEGLKAGDYELSADSATAGASVDHVKVALGDGEQRSLDLELANTGRIAGTVTDAEGKPVAGAWVRFASPRTDAEAGCGADLAGAFACTGLKGGDYKPEVYLAAETAVHMKPAHGPFPNVHLDSDKAAVTNVHLEVQRDELSISGRVIDAAGAPVADARVDAQATEAGQPVIFTSWVSYPHTVSDQNGHFEVRGLVAQTYALRARAGTGAEGIVKDVAAGQGNVVVSVAKAGGIEGTLVGFSATPALYVQKATLRDGFSPATLQGDHFSLDGLAPGNYIITASTLVEGEAKLVEVEAGKTTTVTMTSHGSGRLEGVVTEWGTNKPVAGLVCHTVLRAGEHRGITNWSEASAPKTNAQGLFVLEKAPAGEVAASCFDKDYSTDGETLAVVAPGQTTRIAMFVVKERSEAVGSIGATLDMTGVTPVLEVVYPRGPAAAAGLLVGDGITALDGTPLTGLTASNVGSLISNREVGSTVRITVARAGKPITVSLRIASSKDGSDGAP